MQRQIAVAFSIVLATAMVVGACWLWAHSQPTLGQRPFELARVWGTRCASVATWSCAHTLLAGWTLPLIYRRRAVYIGAAVCTGGIGVLGAVGGAALLLACR